MSQSTKIPPHPKAFHAYKILGWLLVQPMSGYDIKRKLKRTTSMLGSGSNSQIYPVLKQLEQADLVKASIDLQSGGRQRKQYRLTAAGKKYIHHWLQQPAKPARIRDELMLKMSMGFHLNAKQWQQQLAHYRQQLDTTDSELKEIMTHIEQDHQGRADQAYLKLAYQHLTSIQKARRQWIEQCAKILKTKK